MLEQWRLLVHAPMNGAQNMAIDEAILNAVGSGESLPVLRLFAWQPACLSLGVGQPAADADQERLNEHGWELVRRTTGGRAILHTDELTYSVALPAEHRLAAGSIVESYRRLSSALLRAVESIGLLAQADKRVEGAAKLTGPVCFEVPSDYEITAGGKKLIGSAQVRRGTSILQHGSLPLYGDLSRICDALTFPDEAARAVARQRVLERATTLSDAVGRRIEWRTAAEAISSAFEKTFDVRLAEAALSANEQAQAAELYQTRYQADSWTFRV